jgi:ABC-2 type transport system permease protein
MTNSAMWVMWHRQVKSFLRNKQRLFISLVQPVLYLVAFGYGFGSGFQSTDGVSYIQYLIPGIVGMTILMSATMAGTSLIWDKKFGFLKETLVAPVSRTQLLLGRCLGGATTSLAQGIVVLFLGYFLGFRIENWALFPFMLLAMAAVALLFSLLGTVIATKFDDMNSFPSIMNLLMMPMMFLSSGFFPVTNYPKFLQFIININPYEYCIRLLRYVISNEVSNMFLNTSVVIAGITILGIMGTWAFNRIEE